MKQTITFILLMLICVCGYAQTIDPVLLEEMGQRTDDEKINVIVIMKSQYDRQQLGRSAAHYTTRAERREFVVNELKQFAEASQYDLRSTLSEMERQDMTTAPKIIYMANALYFSATKQVINDLAMRRDIELIGLDEKKHVLFDEEMKPANMTREITSNVTQVNADQVWNLGYTGQGVVVAVIDSGVNYNHLDLADHLWDGGSEYPYHGYNFAYATDDPMDDNGHGTHCAGTVCGDGTAGQQTGIAPDATLMCVKVLDAYGYGEASVTCNAMQWAVEQGCDLFSMSLGWEYPTLTERMLFRNTCAAILDAGVIGAIAAGNSGDWNEILYNVGAPGSCPPPYMDPVQQNNPGGLSCAVCVGAVDVNDNAAYFTSRGPVAWDDTEFGDYPYTAGSNMEFGLIRPDVCAPGVDIVSADSWSPTGYTTMSGTSMATPCVAGCISLLLSKNINATPAEICQILEETAVPLEEGKSNTYGYGRVDALAANNAIGFGPLKLETFAVNDIQGNNDGNLNAGENVSLDLTLKNNSCFDLFETTLVLSTESEYVTITNEMATLNYLMPYESLTFEDIFGFTLSENAPGNRPIRFAIETFSYGVSSGIINFDVVVYGHVLRFDEVTVLNDDNGNGKLEAGETADLHVVLSNVGNYPATSIVGVLSTVYPHLTINDANESIGSIEINGQTSVDFNVTLSDDAPDIYIIDFALDLVDENEQHSNLTFELVEGIIVFADPLVKSICVSNWDTDNDGELSYEEAASVSNFPGYPFYGSEITSFDEFQYFTGLSTLKSYFFNDCTRLTSIVLPNSITVIESGAFSGCSNLNSLTIGNSVTSIGEYVFYGCNITNLTIGDSVTSIGEYAFESSSITKLTIGNALASISNYGFASCNINTVYYTGDIDQWCNTQFRGFFSNPLTTAQRLYIDNELITDLVIPETVTEIKDFAFCCAAFLTSVIIPNSVTSIGDYAFFNCDGLTGSLTIPYSVTSIGDYAFQSCYNLNAIYYTGDISQWCNIQFKDYYSNPLNCAYNLYINNELVTDLVIPESVTEIKDYAFVSAKCLTSLIIPNSVTSIGDRAFDDCSNLTSLTIGDSVTSIGEYAFCMCTRLADSLIIPNSVTSIGYAAFADCRNFTSLTIGNSVTTIASGAFSNCSGFTGSLTIPNSVTYIGIGAFRNCSGFTGSLTIPNSVSFIDDYTFRNCSGLTSISIPYSITSVGKSAFYNCSSLESMTVFATTPPVVLDSTSFYGVDKSIPVYVPYGTISAYQTTFGWSEFTNYQEMSYRIIPGYGTGNNKWVFIASPLTEDQNPTMVDNMLSDSNYDLYQFIQSATDEEWQNFKVDNFSLVNGKGYLYANEVDVNVIFKGVFNEDEIKVVSLNYDADKANHGWNLVGNPFPVDAYIDRPYYVMNEDGTALNPVAVPAETPIPPCTAVFVKAVGEGDTAVFTKAAQ